MKRATLLTTVANNAAFLTKIGAMVSLTNWYNTRREPSHFVTWRVNFRHPLHHLYHIISFSQRMPFTPGDQSCNALPPPLPCLIRFVTELTGPTNLVEGQSAHMEARIEPYPDANMKVEWFHNGKPLAMGETWTNIQLLCGCRLLIGTVVRYFFSLSICLGVQI